MRFRSIAILFLACAAGRSVVVDRMAVVVGKRVIKTSDIARDLRVTEFLNRQPQDLSAAAKRNSAERLIDQSVIRDEMERGDYARSKLSDARSMMARLRTDRFGGSDARLKQQLAGYGIDEDELLMALQWQLDVLKFIDERFRPGVMVTDDDVRAYYDQHTAQLRKEYPRNNTFQALAPKIRTSLEGERLNQNFEQWLTAARKRTHIEYRQEAFQ